MCREPQGPSEVLCSFCSTEEEHLHVHESSDLLPCSVAILAVLTCTKDRETRASLALRELEGSVSESQSKKKKRKKEMAGI